MKEIKDIVTAYEIAMAKGQQMALATVVKVVGSSYRRPGARMLVTDDGNLTGAISGGCLEGDALRKALLAITQGQNKLVTYDTTDDDDAKFGVQLGCNGIVYILFEPITEKHNPILLLKQAISGRKPSVLLTQFSLAANNQAGTSKVFSSTSDGALHRINFTLSEQVKAAFATASSALVSVESNGTAEDVFIEYLRPSVSLVIAGAGNDVQPLVNIAALLGWEITVVDGRPTHATSARFLKADKVLVAKPTDVLSFIDIDDETVFLLMTHNYNYDLALLPELLKKNVRYIGALGPKSKLDRMLNDLENNGEIMTEEQRASIFGPVGLDIGAETAEEIALSILAEIKAFLSDRSGGMLRDKTGSIHNRETKTAAHE